MCAEVGNEIWFLFAISATFTYLFAFRPRSVQRWMGARRKRHASLGAYPAALFDERNAWMIRCLGLIPALMLAASLLGIDCYFRGPDGHPSKAPAAHATGALLKRRFSG